MISFLEKHLGVYPNERVAFFRAAALFATVFFFFAVFRNYVDASFLKRYGPSRIPLMLCVSGVLSIVLFALCRRLDARFASRRMLGGFFLLSALAQAGLRFMTAAGNELAYPLLYQLLALQDAFLLVYLWNLAQEDFDARQGKRLFRLLMAAQVLGAALGNLSGSALAGLVGFDNALWVCAGANLILPLLLPRRAPGSREAARPGRGAARPGPGGSVSEALEAFGRYPIFRFLCVCAVLPNLILPILTYQFGTVAEAAFPREHDLLEFLGWLRGSVTVGAFIFIAFLGRLYDRVPTRDLVLAPAVNHCLAFGALGIFFNLAAASYAQFSAIFLQRTVLGPLTKQLFGLLPGSIAAWSQVFARGTLTQVSSLGGALVILALKQEFSPRELSLVALALALLWAVEGLRFRRRYRAGLKQVMAERGLDFDRFNAAAAGLAGTAPSPEPAMEPEAYPEEMLELLAELDVPEIEPETALKDLSAPEEAVRARAAASFALSRDFRAVNALLGLLDGAEPVRRAAIESLSRYDARIMPLLERALEAVEPRVQLGVLEVLRLGRRSEADVVPYVGRRLTRAYEGLILARSLESGPSGPCVGLLAVRLRERRREELGAACLALWAVHPDMRLILQALDSRHASAAAEMLEATLDPVTASRVMPLVDSMPEEEVVARGRRVLPLARGGSPERALAALCADEDPVVRLLARCALGESHAGPLGLPLAEAGLADSDPLARQAAVYARNRCLAKEADMPPVIDRILNLRRFPLFEGLGVRELRAVASIADQARYAPGEVIIGRGQAAPGLHLVVRGTAAKRDAAGRIVTEIKPGEPFGLYGLFLDRPSELEYAAVSDLEAFVITSAAFVEIMKLYPLIGVNMCRYFATLLQSGGRSAKASDGSSATP